MSGIFGCIHLDGAPADRPLLERMQCRLAHRGPDGAELWTGGAAGLGHLAFHTTPESVSERQPLASADGNLCLTLDGRVDNRAELLGDLRAKGFNPREDADSELVLQAYRCWGEACPVRIVGDFAFAVWDRASQRLFCARDAVGIRQFFYFRDARIFLWASEWRALFEHPSVRRTPNETVLAQYLCNCFTSDDDTIFRDIGRLPAGNSLTLTRDGMRVARYWDVDLNRQIRYRRDDEYADHFREIFREAVRCRLRSQAPVAAELSGGLDSSSIVGMAQALRAEGAMASPGLEVFSLSFPGRACDERRFVEAVAQRWGLSPHYSEGVLLERSAYEAQARQDFGLPFIPNATMADAMRREQSARGFRVVLEGGGGDEWFTGSNYRFADLLRQGRLLALAREVRARWGVTAFEHSPKDLLRYGMWPLLPLGLRMAVRRMLGRTGLPSFIAPAFARYVPASDALCGEPVLGESLSFDQAALYQTLRAHDRQRLYEEADRSSSRQRLEMRSPFMDRRMIEFAFALPNEQRWRGDRIKFVLRRAMRALLPETVEARRDKAEFSHTFVETLRGAHAVRGFECPTLERLGWVRGEQARRNFREMASDYDAPVTYTGHLWTSWWLFGIETWMNEVVLQTE